MYTVKETNIDSPKVSIVSTPVEPCSPQTLAEANLQPRGNVYPSPITWRDQILYFLLPDRFSDGLELERKQFDRSNPNQFKAKNKGDWMSQGKRFQGGTLKGIESKLDYLKQLGVTTLWIGPVWRQRIELDTYHGYGIQNFLEVDPRFGSRQDLRDLVDAAHEREMYVILDIIYNHSGNNFFYKDENDNPQSTLPYRFEPPYPVHSWRSGTGNTIPEITRESDGVWPQEFQNIDWYTRAGHINEWGADPWEDKLHPDLEFRRGDFFDLKDINVAKPEVLAGIIKVYQYWIALSDCDGFRIDTVKHIPREVSRSFCGAIREYAESIGKENILLVGEVTDGADMSRNYLEVSGRNLDAVLDIGEPTKRLAQMVKGLTPPREFFSQFEDHNILGSHRETGRYHVSILDDHDMVGRDRKHRFAANNSIPSKYQQIAHAVGVQLTTLGIPCIYYGTEQAFDGTENRHDPSVEAINEYGNISNSDRYIRESMFGGSFGAFETSGCHFFDPDHPTYLRISAIANLRNRPDLIGKTLRGGRQYLRETSYLGKPFAIPDAGELIAWSRILYNQEILVVLNTHGTESRGAYVTIDASLHPHGSSLTLLYNSYWSNSQLRHPPQNQTVIVQHDQGRATVRIELPPSGMMILA
ncbi:MAG: alpha-amylase [Moorea sp. SIO4A3]|nr:alpha-amylase [Moorena sp. SIO4A3]